MQKITYFSNTPNGYECDFIIQHEEQVHMLIQACWSLADSDTRDRELRGIKTAAAETGCKTGYIITFEEEDAIKINNLSINILPAWKWLAQSPYSSKGVE